jgi:alanine-alpha-ketoisovalerate/valine-pyruvate aminotransferase
MKLAMTIDEAMEFADEWSKGLTLYEGAQGWRVVCMLLAEEVRRQRGIEAAAKNLVAQKGRHNTEIAYKRLVDAMTHNASYPAQTPRKTNHAARANTDGTMPTGEVSNY